MSHGKSRSWISLAFGNAATLSYIPFVLFLPLYLLVVHSGYVIFSVLWVTVRAGPGSGQLSETLQLIHTLRSFRFPPCICSSSTFFFPQLLTLSLSAHRSSPTGLPENIVITYFSCLGVNWFKYINYDARLTNGWLYHSTFGLFSMS